MDTQLDEGSARVYQFPRGGRAGLAGRPYGQADSRPIAPSIQPTICSGSWYHDEAIQEAKPAWDR
ncbi:DUF2735 domain-containing protein [Bradyrhizobium sp. HKCCYLS20291]|uniref:DUF2735 domain-containing protein n=1 Tax=Bradyrhizobium sp. HKCCYLS20291 TaxID=3420766 RepID=UPI003EB7DDF1